MVKLPSAGKVSLAMKCLGSVLLPQVKDEGSAATEHGKDRHAVLEKYIKEGRPDYSGYSEIDADLIGRVLRVIGPVPANESAERGIAVNASDWSTGLYSHGIERPNESVDQLVGTSMDRDSQPSDVGPEGSADGAGVLVDDSAAKRAEWFVAIPDLVQQRSATDFAVYDWKTSSWVQDPEYNWQLLVPAIWLYLYAGRPSGFKCELAAIYIDSPDGDGLKRTKPFTADSAFIVRRMEQLADLGVRLRLLSGSGAGGVELYEGKHCMYCPARHRCPAKVGAIVEALKVAWSYNGTEGPSDVEVVRASQAMMDSKPQIDKAAKNILKFHGGELDLGDGRIAVLTEKNGREKIYTKHAKENTTRSDVEENGKRGTEGGGAAPVEGV